MKPLEILCAVMTVLACSEVRAQVRISSEHEFSWCENAGWMNWGEAANGRGAVRLNGTFLSGALWMENIGWINFGNNVPVNGVAYANLNSSDFGVNHNPATGELSGFAWSENAGWVNFGGGALVAHLHSARISVVTPRRFFGYVWSENLGWINLDGAETYVQLNTCPADLNVDGVVDDVDFVAFASAYDALECSALNMPQGCPADLNVDGVVDDADFSMFVVAYDVLLCS